jgi:RNA polymerase-binding transcription factor DksA
MDDDEVRARLEQLALVARAQLSTLTARFDEIVEAADGVATDDEHDPEGHTIAWERQQASALAADARAALDDVDAALARLDAGTYGTCTVCDGPIAIARLEALPATSTCIGCASR